MRLIKELFSERGDVSTIRFMSIISLFAAIGLAFTGKDACVMIFVAAAFGGKVGQKIIENKTK